MRWGRALGVLLLAGSALVASAPHALAQSASGAWTSPAPRGSDGGIPVAYLEEPQPLRGYATHPDGIVAVTFRLERDAEPRPDSPCAAARSVRPQTATGGSSRVDFSFEASFPCNRRYLVRAIATPADRPLQPEPEPLVLDLWVAVAVPPAEVTGVTAKEVAGGVELRWDGAEHEADFQGFEVRRAVGDGPFKPIAEAAAAATSFVDTDVPPAGGHVRYQVFGMRPGPDGGTTVFSRGASAAEVDLAAPSSDPADGDAAGDGDGDGDAPGDQGGVGSSGGSGRSGVRSSGPTGAAGARNVTRTEEASGPRTTTTLDTGYQEALPFRKPKPAASPAGDPAVVARLADDDESTRRQTMLLVAGGATAFSWAMALRFLARRATI